MIMESRTNNSLNRTAGKRSSKRIEVAKICSEKKSNTEPEVLSKDALKRKRATERRRRDRKKRIAKETPEETIYRRFRTNEKVRLRRKERQERANEPASVTEARQKAIAEKKLERRRLAQEKRREDSRAAIQKETAEQRAARLARLTELYHQRNFEKVLKQFEALSGREGLSVAEVLYAERKKRIEKQRQNQILREAHMTLEQKEALRMQNREYIRLKGERLKKAPDENAAFRARINERKKFKREFKNNPQAQAQWDFVAWREHRLYTQSKKMEFYIQRFKGKEMPLSIQQLLLRDDIKIEKEVLQETWLPTIPSRQQNISEIKEGSQDEISWSRAKHSEKNSVAGRNLSSLSNFSFLVHKSLTKMSFQNEKSFSSCVVRDALYCMKAIIDIRAKRDRYVVYGIYIANKIRGCGRNDKEINIAKELIDNVIKKFITG